MKVFRLRTRETAEALELEQLAPAATRSSESRGRAVPEEPDPWRTPFERDHDRILHSKAFRRLKHKTQVFMNPEGDHFVTRMTHTLQVTQIGGAIARA
ncbi:MAG: deoxyguanosinetriphosphate triphosphohydrolase, partial [Acidimicrobiia bacterium]